MCTVQELDIIDLEALEVAEGTCPRCGGARKATKPSAQYLAATVGDFMHGDKEARFSRVHLEFFRQVEAIAFLPAQFCGSIWQKEQAKWRELFMAQDFKRDEISYTAKKAKEVQRDHLAALRAIRAEHPHLYRLRNAREAEYKATLELTAEKPLASS
jgi:hypothetical protein